jgi:hypothetical protein
MVVAQCVVAMRSGASCGSASALSPDSIRIVLWAASACACGCAQQCMPLQELFGCYDLQDGITAASWPCVERCTLCQCSHSVLHTILITVSPQSACVSMLCLFVVLVKDGTGGLTTPLLSWLPQRDSSQALMSL